ncbi:MAG: helicase-related protein [Ignavibacteria bacterium]|jgi:SNF2 family DNA or RNA helicase|nr:helicase-related protein [Ignavibacteria bacterium]MDH7528817.1 helicase-related protein [Ignavibacteria bacterium]
MKKGDLIRGPFWPEPIIVKDTQQIDHRHIYIIGKTQKSNEHIERILDLEDLDKIEIITSQKLFTQEAWKVFLSLEAIRYRYAALYDPLLAMNISKVDPVPHQIEAVYGYVLKYPRIRFLIADDPGAGKTIMAGLIIKELKLRQLVKRILIVAPGHLKDQWRRELQERFDEHFEVIERSRFEAVYRINVWEKENQCITSIDFAKQEDVLPTLAATQFDLVIVDEAHKMSAYKYGERVNKSERYKLGEVLSSISHHLLFLTATPHKGDPENFRLFLDLLEPGFFANKEMVEQSNKNKDNPLFIRRLKEDLKDFDGKPLFLPRYVKTVPFDLGTHSPQEKELYNELSKYVENQYNLALSKNKKRNLAFALVILQRRLASSVYALLRSLERRKKKLEELLENAQRSAVELSEIQDLLEIEDLSENERWQKESEWETLSVAETKEELQKEIQIINNLIEKAKEIIQNENEIKLIKLKQSLNELSQKVEDRDKRKILIFTESKDTLDYLEKKIREWGYSVNTIHGAMKLEDRVNAEAVFKNQTEIMVATEAAGEGINLQFCNLMINYDIPWNPNRLEQRMGRIHRYGQTREVFVHNLVASDTREGQVLTILFEKIEEIKRALGTDKVFDVLGEIIDSKQFAQAMLDAAVNARSIDEIIKTLEIKVDEQYIAKIKENLGETLATRYIDYTHIKEMAQKAKEHRLIPEYTQSFFIKAFEKAGGKIKKLDNKFISIDNVPYSIRNIAEDEAFKKCFGRILKNYPKVTFDKEVSKQNPKVEFISFGHPLFEAVLQWVEKNLLETIYTGAVFYDPDGKLNGYILFYEGEIKDGTGSTAGKRLFSFFVTDGEVKPIPPSIIWDLAEGNLDENENFIDREILKNQVIPSAIKSLEFYKDELQQERKRQAEIKQKYGIKSLEYLIVKLDGEIIELESRKDRKENVDLPLRMKKEKKAEYEQALTTLKIQIEQEQSLSMTMPRFLGIIRVVPMPGETARMANDEEIEAIGMRLAMEYEHRNGRKPEDVSSQNLGFDIKSSDDEGNIRYIEVKARAQLGPVALTQNEWFKAQRFGNEYYLYVVFNAATNPELHIIPNPAEILKPEEKFEIVRYLVDHTEILNKGIRG